MANAPHIISFRQVLTGAAAPLVWTGSPTTPATEQPYVRSLSIQAESTNSNPCYVGGPGVDSTTGIVLPTPAAGPPVVPYPPYMLDVLDGKLRLNEVFVNGTNTEAVHVLAVVYV